MKKRRNRPLSTLTTLLVIAALVDQLRRPAKDRTWYGTIVGIPYDFRPPTPERLRATFWNKNDPRIFTPRPFGVGWGVNVYRLLHRGQ
ncbi:MAG TPA: DUF5808 domain-containing protein [Chloroflexota bacterium]